MACVIMSATEFIFATGRQLGRTDKQLRPIVELIVDHHWYDTVESLRALSKDQWRRFGLPVRLMEALRENLGVNQPKNAVVGTAIAGHGESVGPEPQEVPEPEAILAGAREAKMPNVVHEMDEEGPPAPPPFWPEGQELPPFEAILAGRPCVAR